MRPKPKLPYWVYIVSLLVPLVGFAISTRGPNMLDHIGAEYDSIARAIVAGRGFSDPFEVESGPTAWMPPVLPILMAAGYWLADNDRMAVIAMFVGLQGIAIATTCLFVIRESIRIGRVGWGLLILSVGILVNFHTLFYFTHDHALLLLVSWVLFWIMTRWPSAPSGAIAVGCGVAGGIVALCSPVMAAAWAVWTAVSWRASIRSVAIAAFVSIAVISPWMIRNRVVLGRWVPIKSAGKFELWQSMCLDNDGVMDMFVMIQHPWGKDNEARRRYVELGEIAFIDTFDTETSEKFKTEPVDCLDRIANRFASATLFWEPLSANAIPQTLRVVRSIVFVFPFLAMFVILLRTDRTLAKQESAAIWIYAAVLVPYVLISYYDRYAAPLIGIKMLMVLYATASLPVSRRQPVP
ncbi:hypothetical protein CA13_11590 [Planctomycetes bacterium CA13]|uniref:Glycosyltransferase RgtA/B/C/D-like domain-containing protein n=1 Tax=Novipirellula herctigrandis TaxID=2527986 RepID=A0A5C5YXJ6_9BACT|nr:hypothetical protein CA13_11590 [Planctomycetes bacterium CA13]